MTTVIVGKRHVPLEHIALLEPFDSSAQSRMQSERPAKRASCSTGIAF